MTEETSRGGRVISVITNPESVEIATHDGDGYAQITVMRLDMADRVRCGDTLFWIDGEGSGNHAYWRDDRELLPTTPLKRIGPTRPYTPIF